jgi:photosynthetic reaction center H subunit
MTETFVGTIDLAQVSLYLFWIFFFGLIVYLQRENMREGFPLENDKGEPAPNAGIWPMPEPKTFKLPHGRGEVSYPNNDTDTHREFAMQQVTDTAGAPFEPTGDPLVDGIGPAAWAERRDEPELDGHGHPKIRPMRALDEVRVTAGRDARGLPVEAHDGEVVGEVTDMWIDVPEQLVRYLEYKRASDGATRLVPIQLVWIRRNKVRVNSLYGKHFANVPGTAADDRVTMLEEEKICAYYCGGKLYASEDRLEPQL